MTVEEMNRLEDGENEITCSACGATGEAHKGGFLISLPFGWSLLPVDGQMGAVCLACAGSYPGPVPFVKPLPHPMRRNV